MSDRVSKQYSRKSRQSREVDKELERIRKEREITTLADSVRDFGDEAEMPCTRCFRGNKRCVMSADSSRCDECIRSKKSCDGTRVASSRKSFLAASLFVSVGC
jgi:hypothetical protein